MDIGWHWGFPPHLLPSLVTIPKNVQVNFGGNYLFHIVTILIGIITIYREGLFEGLNSLIHVKGLEQSLT